jgi:GNAT superfamily N-acetyltransferase
VIRQASPFDCEAIWRLICELAEYEKLEHQLEGSPDLIREHLFGEHRFAESLVAEVGGAVVGYALFFHNYSTFRTQPGLWLEDLIVTPAMRGKGIGKALLVEVGRIARERRCGRFEWAVLSWNEPAIKFYESMGAKRLLDWQICRVEGEALETFGD